MLIVQKYGGSSVADHLRINNVASRIAKARFLGNNVVVVVSAKGKTTDHLLQEAALINPKATKRELDMLLSTGEQSSAALLAMAIQKFSQPAISLNAYQAGIETTSSHQSARIKNIDCERINSELDLGNVVIITGFQGFNARKDITTLGRGGSDTTAVALAAALHADICEIYTDVDGIYSADPRIVPDAALLSEISYNEMLEMAALGANVLAKRSVGLAKKYGVKLVVRSSFTQSPGTIVKEEVKMEHVFISGIAVDKSISRISIKGIDDAPGVWFKVFSIMNNANIPIDFIQQTKLDAGTKDISFTIAKDDLSDALAALNGNTHRLPFIDISHMDNLAKLSVVSTGMATNPRIPSVMFESLYEAGINIDSISTSEIRASVLIDIEEADRAAQVVHGKFKDDKYLQ